MKLYAKRRSLEGNVKMKKYRILPGILVSVMCATSGCSVIDSAKIAQETSDKSAGRKAVMAEAFKSSFAGKTNEQPLVVTKDEIFIASRSSSSKGDANLPAIFSNVVLRFPGRYTLAAVAERITKETRIPVTIDSDVARATEGAQPMNIAIQKDKRSYATLVDQDPFVSNEKTVDVYRNTPNTLYSEEFELDFTGSLSELLDLIAAKGRISWEYRKGVISFSKTITKRYFIKALPGKISSTRTMNASIGGGGAATGSAGTGNSTTSSQFSPLDGIAGTIKDLLSPIGKMSADDSSGVITVTDIKEVQDRVDSIVRSQNELMNRQVRLRVDFISVNYDSTAQAGVDISTALSNLSKNGNIEAVNLKPGGSLVGGDAGNISYKITGLDFDASVLLQALSNVGQTTLLSRKAVTTLNRQSAPIKITNQKTYLAKTTPAAGGLTGGSAPGLEPGTVTTGLNVDVLPVVSPDNSLLVQVSLDISELISLGTISTGSGPTLQQIQTPEVSSMSFLERVSLKNGETLVMVGYERDKSSATNRDALTGFSTAGTQGRQAFVIALTPTLD